MAGSMKAVTETGIELSNEERNLLSVAYKVDVCSYSNQIWNLDSLGISCRWEGFLGCG